MITEGHVFALIMCTMLGLFPLGMVYLNGNSMAFRKNKFVWGWFLFWASPGLISLWLKGILG